MKYSDTINKEKKMKYSDTISTWGPKENRVILYDNYDNEEWLWRSAKGSRVSFVD